MIFKQFQNDKLSLLGLGAMRLPTVNGNDSEIDEAASAEMVDYAIRSGINYFDTAWGYHGGNSEVVMGKILANYPRESFYLASKFPGYDLSNMDKVEEIFEKQLEKCQVSYFDFYLFHNVCEMNIDPYLDPKYRIFEYLMEQKKNGRIRHLGFSAHGNMDTIRRFLDAYGDAMEFGQLQINYLDWEFQEARQKTALLAEYGIPVWVMEPVRGGKLACLCEEYMQKLCAHRPDAPAVSWAFRFLQSIPEVSMVLSGMSNFDQLKQNIGIFEQEDPLSEAEMQTLLSIAKDMMEKASVPCTSCRYCTTHCPQEIDIPQMISLYNEHVLTGGGFLAPMALQAIPESRHPSACLGCRSCEAVCPQQIAISEVLADFVQKLR